jgi:MFS family permease
LQKLSNSPLLDVLILSRFRTIWYFGIITEIGRRMELFVLIWILLEITNNSPYHLGIFLLINNVPRPMFSIFTGLLADRYNRNTLLILGAILNVITAIALFSLISIDILVVWHILVASWLNGFSRALEDPARRTGILDIVGERRIVNAVSVDSFSQMSGKIIGPILGAALFTFKGYPGAYLTILLINILTVVIATRISIPKKTIPSDPEPVLRSLKNGMIYVKNSKMILGMFYVTILMNGLAFEAFNFIPDIGKNYLLVSPILVGVLVASEGIGQGIGAFMLSLTRNINRYGLWFVVGSSIILVVIILFSWSNIYILSIFLLLVSGMALSVFATMQSTIAMLYTPSDMRGRVMGLLSICIGTGHLLAFEIGLLASKVGTPWALSLNAAIGLILIIPSLTLTPIIKIRYTQTLDK